MKINRNVFRSKCSIMKTFIIVFVCITFLFYYMTDLYSSNLNAIKKRDVNHQIEQLQVRQNEIRLNKLNEIENWILNRELVDKVELIFNKYFIDNPTNEEFYLLIYIGVYLLFEQNLSLLFLKLRKWLRSIDRLKNRLMAVRYIHLKDGKKRRLLFLG